MNDAQELYNEGKLLARAMGLPLELLRDDVYDCSTWANEFILMMKNKYFSVSSTLIIPNVAVSLYKNIGFLVNSDLVDCYHISKNDSNSSGNIDNGDFIAGKNDFNSILELATYIKSTHAVEMNEVNFNGNINSVVGLFIQKPINIERQFDLLKIIYAVQKCLEIIVGITYPIYMYDRANGIIQKIEITKELEDKIHMELNIHKVF